MAVGIAFVSLLGCSRPAPTSNIAAASADPTWYYTTTHDDMSGQDANIMSLDSINDLPANGPYPAGKLNLTLIGKGDNLDIMLSLPQQFVCNEGRPDFITVRFDSGTPEEFACKEMPDGDTKRIFVSNQDIESEITGHPIDPILSFIGGLRHSKHALVRVTVFEGGSQDFSFNTTGLKLPSEKSLSSAASK
jgi:hypothetical protein